MTPTSFLPRAMRGRTKEGELRISAAILERKFFLE
jgi:hypothetical protein